MVLWKDIISTVGNTISTFEGVQFCGGQHQYCGGIPFSTVDVQSYGGIPSVLEMETTSTVEMKPKVLVVTLHSTDGTDHP